MKRDGGFVLVNALVLVAALSAVSVYLLSRAEGNRVRLAAAQDGEALALGLDAVEALALTQLDADWAAGGPDHAGEAWAAPQSGLQLARGTASVRIYDAQGRFNVNWLADPSDEPAHEAFERLAGGLAVAPSSIAALADFVQPGGPDDRTPYAALMPPLDPVGGAILMIEQAAEVPGIDPASFARLAPHVTALTQARGLNVNTVTPEVLAAFLPGVARARIDRALARRRSEPFISPDDFLSVLGGLGPTGADAPDDEEALLRPDHILVASRWFILEARVTLDGRAAERVALIERRGLPEGSRIAWRLTAPP